MSAFNKLVIFAIVVALLALGFFGMTWLSSMKELPEEKPPKKVVNYVKVEPVSYNDIDTEINVYGRVGSSQPIDLIAEVAGKLTPGSIRLRPGSSFTKGDLICKIYDADYRLNVQSRKSEFLTLLANTLPDIKFDFPESYDQWKAYFDSIEINENLPQYPAARSEKERIFLASKSLLREYFSIKSLEENLKKYYIYAPYNGSVVTVNREIGSVVNPGSSIGRIIKTDDLELEIPVEVEDIEWVELGTEVDLYSENGQFQYEGRVARIGNVVNPSTQSVQVFVAIRPVRGQPLYDGMYLNAVIDGKTVMEAMSVPRSILSSDNTVFVVENDSLLQQRNVNLLKIAEDSAIINGLNEGARLVVEAPSNASNDMVVKVVN